MKFTPALFLLFLFTTTIVISQPGTLDESFNPYGLNTPGLNGPNKEIKTAEVQADGKIIIGGYFTSYNGTAKKYIARLNEDGSLDESFAQGIDIDGEVLELKILENGKIMIGGLFEKINGKSRYQIARLNEDGSLDESYESNYKRKSNSQYLVFAFSKFGETLISNHNFNATENKEEKFQRYPLLINESGTVDSTFLIQFLRISNYDTTEIAFDGIFIQRMVFDHENSPLINYSAITLGGPERHLHSYFYDGSMKRAYTDTTFYLESKIIDFRILQNGKILAVRDENDIYSNTSNYSVISFNEDLTYASTNYLHSCSLCVVYDFNLDKDGRLLLSTASVVGQNAFLATRYDSTEIDSTFSRSEATMVKYYSDISKIILPLKNDKILCIGSFTLASGRNGIVRLNGGDIIKSASEHFLNHTITIFPNPAKELLHVQIPFVTNEEVFIRIFDTNGKLQKVVQAKNSRTTINISDLSNGHYLIQISSASKVIENKKFIKLEE